MIQGADFTIDYAVAKFGAGGDDLGKLGRPVQALAAEQGRLATDRAQLHPVAIELDLVRPACARRRLV